MKIIDVKPLAISGVYVIRFGRFRDHRGFFTEPFRHSDLQNHPQTPFLKGLTFVQANESWSRPGTVRGLHFQWNPFMGKLVRTMSGRMVDLFLDIRKGSPTCGKLSAYEMAASVEQDYDEWIWVPPGFAHGNYFTETSQIQYLCSGEYSQGCEACVSPLAPDVDWSLAPPSLAKEFRALQSGALIISDKDRGAMSFAQWMADPRSENFLYAALSQTGRA